jgi:hypothetical protein
MGNRNKYMKQVKIIANANHETLEMLANEAVNDTNFLEIHFSVHSVLVIFQVPDNMNGSVSAGNPDNK